MDNLVTLSGEKEIELRDNKRLKAEDIFEGLLALSVRTGRGIYICEEGKRFYCIKFSGVVDVTIRKGGLKEYRALATILRQRAGMAADFNRHHRTGEYSTMINGIRYVVKISTTPLDSIERFHFVAMDQSMADNAMRALGLEDSPWRKRLRQSDGVHLICGQGGAARQHILDAIEKEMKCSQRECYVIERNDVGDEVILGRSGSEKSSVTIPYAAKAIMRSSPDVVIFNRVMGDGDAELAVQMAIMGVLVFIFLGTEDLLDFEDGMSVEDAIYTLMDDGVDKQDLSFALRSVLCYRSAEDKAPGVVGTLRFDLHCFEHDEMKTYLSEKMCARLPAQAQEIIKHLDS